MLLATLLLAAGSGGTLVVLNKAEASASLVDLASGQVAATLPTGAGPHEVSVSPDGRLALATNYGPRGEPGSSLTLIDVAAAKVARTIGLGALRRPHGVAWLDGRRALVTCEDSQALAEVDVEAGTVLGTVATGQQTSHMVVVGKDRQRAYVANIGSGTVTAVDVAARRVLAQIATGAGAEGLDLAPGGGELWVGNREADTLAVVDAAGLRVAASLPSKGYPIRVKLTPDGKLALVSHARSGDVAVFDVAGRRELRRVAMKLDVASPEGRLLQGFGQSPVPVGIVIAPDGQTAFVANSNADAIAVVSLSSFDVTRLLRAGREPDGMAFTPVVPAR